MTRRRLLVVVSDPQDFPELPPERCLTADAYLADGAGKDAGVTVVNLCRSYRYRTRGYYVSLLADARGHAVLPSVEAIEGLAEPFGVFRVLQEAGVQTVDLLQMRAHRLAVPTTFSPEDDEGSGSGPLLRVENSGTPSLRPASDAELVEIFAYFGLCDDPRFRTAVQAVYREWPTPVLRLQFVLQNGGWRVAHVAPVPLKQLGPEQRLPLSDALQKESWVLRRGAPVQRALKRASIAVLTDETDPFSPSSPETLDRLTRVAARMNVYVQRIGLHEIDRLGEYDALFIRALTGVRDPAFQFALRAEMLDMPVVDDAQSIIRCGNKVFLEELLRREEIPTPRTQVVSANTSWAQLAELGSPVVIKLPDGSFSNAVSKCGSEAEYQAVARDMFRRSPLLIAQEYVPTAYDWRVVVLDGRVLFTAKYHMARGHWQIRTEDAPGVGRYGRVEAVARDQAPREIVDLALRAANLIGSGLYGVDLKETGRGPVVIEINDNPNLDVGYDDAADGGVIYEDLVNFFLRRLEQRNSSSGEPQARSLSAPRSMRRSRKEPPRRHYRPFSVAGMELEYASVDRDLNVVPLVEDALRVMAGHPTSDIDLGRVAVSNEIAAHVFELKTSRPMRSLRQAEAALVEGVQQLSFVLRKEFGARLLPTGMHPWLDPRRARLWTRSNARIYQSYARLFDVYSHGWLNVQAAHLNLPLGRESEAVALHNAAALLVPYLPAIAASSPVYDGELQEAVDGRLFWILKHQANLPASQGELVPEYVTSFRDYRKNVLGAMYRELDGVPDTGALRHEFLNARGAVMKFSRQALELRVLDAQECVKMDVAIAVFARSALQALTRSLLRGKLALPEHAPLVEDLKAVIHRGSSARVHAPHLGRDLERDEQGRASVRAVLRALLLQARKTARKDEAEYLDLVERVIETGSLSERIRASLLPLADEEEEFTEAARRIYIELAECLEANEPWRGRGL